MQKSLERDQDDTELILIRYKEKSEGRKEGKEGKPSFHGLQGRRNLRRNCVNVTEIPR